MGIVKWLLAFPNFCNCIAVLHYMMKFNNLFHWKSYNTKMIHLMGTVFFIKQCFKVHYQDLQYYLCFPVFSTPSHQSLGTHNVFDRQQHRCSYWGTRWKTTAQQGLSVVLRYRSVKMESSPESKYIALI